MIYGQLNKNRIFLILLVMLIFMPLLVFKSDSFADEKLDQLTQKMMNANNQGNYIQALKWAQEAYDYTEIHFGSGHVNTLAMLNNMAFLYKITGNYENAESFYEKALKLGEDILGKEHPDMLTVGNNLAGLYVARGEYEKAEPLLKKALKLREQIFGPKHSDIIYSLNSLAELYIKQGHYEKAELLLERALNLSKEILGFKHLLTFASLNNMASLYEKQGRYVKAEQLFKKSLELCMEMFGSEHPYTFQVMDNIGRVYIQQDQYKEAEQLLKNVLELREKNFGLKHPDTIESMTNLAGAYQVQGRYSEAEPLFKNALTLSEEVFGSNHPDIIVHLNNLAELYKDQGRYGEAEPLLKKALKLNREILDPKHPDTIHIMSSLGGLLEKQGNYQKAEKLFKDVLKLRKEILGLKHPDTIKSLVNLAGLYSEQGRYKDVNPLLKEALKLSQELPGKNHSITLTIINNIAQLHEDQGQYAHAEKLYTESLDLCETTMGPEHPDTLTIMNNLGSLYVEQGRYGEAEPLLKKALKLRDKALGPKHPDTLHSMNNLAGLYLKQESYESAEPLFKKALELSEQVLGPDHPDTIRTLNNLEVLYHSQGQYGEAEPLFKKALALHEKIFGLKHRDTLHSMNNLAMSYIYKKRYEEAEPLFLKALEVSREILGQKHPDTLIVMESLAVLYQGKGEYQKAEPFFEETLKLNEEVLGLVHPDTLNSHLNYSICLVNLEKYQTALLSLKKLKQRLLSRTGTVLYTTQKQRVRRQFTFSVSKFQNTVFTLAHIYKTADSIGLAADVILKWKHLQSEEEAYTVRLVQTTKDRNIRTLAEEIMKLRSGLSEMALSATPEKLSSAIEELEEKELALLKISPGYKGQLQVDKADIDNILAMLTKNSALIELKKYQAVDFATGDYDEARWIALLVLPENKFFLEVLGPVQETRNLWDVLRLADDMMDIPQDEKKDEKKIVIRTDHALKQNLPEKIKGLLKAIRQNHFKTGQPVKDLRIMVVRELYQNLFGNLEKHIQNVNTLYIAPDGFLNLISFNRLILPDGKYWIERQDLRRIHTGRALLNKTGEEKTGSLLGIGGVDFDQYPEAMHTIPVKNMNSQVSNYRTGNALGAFKPLPFSLQEIKKIAPVYRGYRGSQATVLTGTNACEARLKELKTAPEILHLSTHGFYLASRKDKIERPLMLSGLALAGANLGLKGRKGPDGEDGILYSLEILGLNLKGTSLVSLSACDTGKGVVDYSEGVYGLVRAFRIAGARSVLMTLWPVKDRESKDFMVSFYNNWLKQDKDPAEALRKTRLDYIHNKNNPKLRDPKVWAPYVLSGK